MLSGAPSAGSRGRFDPSVLHPTPARRRRSTRCVTRCARSRRARARRTSWLASRPCPGHVHDVCETCPIIGARPGWRVGHGKDSHGVGASRTARPGVGRGSEPGVPDTSPTLPRHFPDISTLPRHFLDTSSTLPSGPSHVPALLRSRQGTTRDSQLEHSFIPGLFRRRRMSSTRPVHVQYTSSTRPVHVQDTSSTRP